MKGSLSLAIAFLAPFLAGTLFGGFVAQMGTTPTSKSNGSNLKGKATNDNLLGPKHGSVVRLEDIPIRKTSHVDENGKPIVKQQLLEPFVVPNFVGYSIATFEPGQTMMPPHEHNSLHEFFYVIEGEGIIQKDGVDHEVKPGTFLHMAPHEQHGIWIPKNAKNAMKMVVSGVTVGEK